MSSNLWGAFPGEVENPWASPESENEPVFSANDPDRRNPKHAGISDTHEHVNTASYGRPIESDHMHGFTQKQPHREDDKIWLSFAPERHSTEQELASVKAVQGHMKRRQGKEPSALGLSSKNHQGETPRWECPPFLEPSQTPWQAPAPCIWPSDRSPLLFGTRNRTDEDHMVLSEAPMIRSTLGQSSSMTEIDLYFASAVQEQNAWEDDISKKDKFSHGKPPAPEVSTSNPEDDDFGDFEIPDAELLVTRTLSSSPRSPKLVEFSRNGRMSRDYQVTDTSKSQFHLPNSLSRQEHDQHVGLGRLGHTKMTVASLVEHSEGLKMEGAKLELSSQSTPISDTSVDASYPAEEWGEFSPSPRSNCRPETTRTKIVPPSGTHVQSSSTLSLQNRFHCAPPASSDFTPQPKIPAPPKTIPPPSLLLSHLAILLQDLATAMTSTPSTSTVLATTIPLLCTMSRVLIGRRLRWKRDTELATSMSLAPAHAGGSRGMKLVSVDKAETAREDREAQELLRAWTTHSGKVRRALASRGVAQGGKFTQLPEIKEGLRIETKAFGEGKKALAACWLCGLKREERVRGVDDGVWDTGQEWWKEGWGHVECWTFWEREGAKVGKD